MKLSLFDYHLPHKLITQKPVRPRDHSRLFVYNKKTDKIQHKHFYDLPKFLKPGDVLVLNNSKVFPARLIGKKTTGGKIEIFLLKYYEQTSDVGSSRHRMSDCQNTWEVMIGGKIKHSNEKITITKNLFCTIIDKNSNNSWLVKFNLSGNKFWQQVEKYGQAPLPPYIKTKSNLKEYQTVYAKIKGSVAAPTAGFHFTKPLLNKLKKQGVQIEYITLHVGLGTFAPVKEKNITKHQIHSELAEINQTTARRLNQAKKQGRRIVAVGTTAIRTLEAFSVVTGRAASASGVDLSLQSGKKWTNIFIYPGYKFRFVDCSITNFHLPKSTLLMLIAAFLGNKKTGIIILHRLYKIAIKNKYRFYSFGDGMFIE